MIRRRLAGVKPSEEISSLIQLPATSSKAIAAGDSATLYAF